MSDLEALDSLNDRLCFHTPWDHFVAPGIARNKDGSIMRMIELRPNDTDSSTDLELMGVCGNLSRFLGLFGTGWTHHLEVSRRKQCFATELRSTNPLARMVEEERARQLRRANLFRTRFFNTVTYLPPSATLARMERFYLKRRFDERAVDVFRDVVWPFAQATNVYARILDTLMAWARVLDDDGAATFLHSTVSPHDHDVVMPTYRGWPIEEVVQDTSFVRGSLPLMDNVDGHVDFHLRTIGIRGYPEQSYPAILSGLDRLAIEYRFVQRFVCLSATDAQSVFERIWRQRKENKVSWGDYLYGLFDKSYVAESDPIRLMHSMEALAARQEAAYDPTSSGYLTSTVTVWDLEPVELQRKVDAVLEEFRKRGFAAEVETNNAWRSYLSGLPGECRSNPRIFPLPSIHPAMMFPVSAPWQGPGRNERLDSVALLTMTADGLTAVNVDTHWGDTGNVLIVAPVRTGKSTLVAEMCMAWHKHGDVRIFAFDVDAELSALMPACLMAGGDALSFARGDLALQPLVDLDDEDEFIFWRGWLVDWMRVHRIDEKSRLSLADMGAGLTRAMEILRGEPRHRRTFEYLLQAVQHRDLKVGLADCCGNGVYAPILNASEDRIGRAHWCTFELTGLLGKGPASALILDALMRKVERLLDGRPTLVPFDEAWLALSAMPERLDGWLRRLPKRNASLVLSTHSLTDIARGDLAATLDDNCKTKIMLANPVALEDSGRKVLEAYGFNEQQCRIIGHMMPKRDVYLKRPDGARLVQNEMDELQLAVCAAGGERDRNLLRDTLATHGRGGFPVAWLRAKGLYAQADELERRLKETKHEAA